MRRFKMWWSKLSTNEKMMYPLLALLVIGIATRWRHVFAQVADAFSGLFQ